MSEVSGTSRSTKRSRSSVTSYSNLQKAEVEKIVGISFNKLLQNNVVDYRKILTEVKSTPSDLKDVVFDRIVDIVDSEGYPSLYLEAVRYDYISTIMTSIIAYIKRKTNIKDIRLAREETINDGNNKGKMEYMVVNEKDDNSKTVIIIEAKKDNVTDALSQCLLATKASYEQNGDAKPVYGFITTAITWQLIVYDKTLSYHITKEYNLLYTGMSYETKSEWDSTVIDMIYTILLSI
jgi:hypothetical protein